MTKSTVKRSQVYSVLSTQLHRTCPVCEKVFDSTYHEGEKFRTQFKMHMRYAHGVRDNDRRNQVMINQTNATPHGVVTRVVGDLHAFYTAAATDGPSELDN